MGHLFLGETILSGSEFDFSLQSDNPTERFCNTLAAEALLPARDFAAQIPADWKKNDDEVISSVSRRYWVSRAAVGIRLVELDFADQAYLNQKWKQLQSSPRRQGGAVMQHEVAIGRFGDSFVRLALSAYYDRRIHGGELSDLLGMSLKHLPALESSLFKQRAHTA